MLLSEQTEAHFYLIFLTKKYPPPSFHTQSKEVTQTIDSLCMHACVCQFTNCTFILVYNYTIFPGNPLIHSYWNLWNLVKVKALPIANSWATCILLLSPSLSPSKNLNKSIKKKKKSNMVFSAQPFHKLF